MAKKTARKVKKAPRRKAKRASSNDDQYILIVHGWIFLVAFALMLGMGVVVGNFINDQLNSSAPQVAGYQVEAK